MDLAPPAAAADTAQADPARERTERRIRRLAQLAEIGLDLADMLRQQARAAKWFGTEGPQMFACLARAVRQTTALEERLDADARAREQQGVAEQARRAAGAERTRKRQKAQVRRLVEAAIKSDADPSDAERLLVDLHERLDDPDIEAEFGNRSIGEIVAGICQDLGVTTTMSQWPDEWLGPDEAPSATGDGAALNPALSRSAGEGVKQSPPPGPGFDAGPGDTVDTGSPPAARPPRAATGNDPP
jgi:hypothetical protein